MNKTIYTKVKGKVILLLLSAICPVVTANAYAFKEKSDKIILADIVVKGTVRIQGNSGQVEAMPGINVLEKGTQNGTTTDGQGNFQLTVKDNAVLVISMVGYKTQEIPVAGRTTMDLTLQEEGKSLEEVVVTGYQTIDRKMFTGSAVLLKGDDAKRSGRQI